MVTDTPEHVSLQVLGARISHQQEDLSELKQVTKEILARLSQLAAVDEVRQLRDEITTLRAENTALRADHRAMETRIRVVEDDRTAARAVLTVASFVGLGTLGAFFKWFVMR